MINASQIFAKNVLGSNPGTSLLNSVNSAEIIEEKIDTGVGHLCCWHNLDSHSVDLTKPVIVIFYAQTHLMSSPTTLSRINYFIEREYRVFCYDRRNSGASSKGDPMLFLDDARCVMDYIINIKKCSPETIACLAWCAGTGIAANMARIYKTGALILGLAYTKIKDRFFLTENLDDLGLNCDENIEKYSQACLTEGRTAKIFIMNGQRDFVTPFKMTIKLLRRCENAKACVVIVPDGGHNDIPFRLYANEIESFLLTEQPQSIRIITKRKNFIITHANTVLSDLYTQIFSTKLDPKKDLTEVTSNQVIQAIEALDHFRLDLLESLWDFSVLPLAVSADKEFKVSWKAFRLTMLISSIKTGSGVLPILSNLYGNGFKFLLHKSGVATEKLKLLKENLDIIADYYIDIIYINFADIPADFVAVVNKLKTLAEYNTSYDFRRALDLQVAYLCQQQNDQLDLENQLLFLLCRFGDDYPAVNAMIQKLGGDIVKKSYIFEDSLIAIQKLSMHFVSENNFLRGYDLTRLINLFKDIAPATVYDLHIFSRVLQHLMFIDIPVFQYLYQENSTKNLLYVLMTEALNLHIVLSGGNNCAHTDGIAKLLAAVEKSKKINNDKKNQIKNKILLCCAYFNTVDFTDQQKEIYIYLRIKYQINKITTSDEAIAEAIDLFSPNNDIAQWPILSESLKKITPLLHQLVFFNGSVGGVIRGFINRLHVSYNAAEADIVQFFVKSNEIKEEESQLTKDDLIYLLIDLKRYIRFIAIRDLRASRVLKNKLNGLLDDAIVALSKIEVDLYQRELSLDTLDKTEVKEKELYEIFTKITAKMTEVKINTFFTEQEALQILLFLLCDYVEKNQHEALAQLIRLIDVSDETSYVLAASFKQKKLENIRGLLIKALELCLDRIFIPENILRNEFLQQCGLPTSDLINLLCLAQNQRIANFLVKYDFYQQEEKMDNFPVLEFDLKFLYQVAFNLAAAGRDLDLDEKLNAIYLAHIKTYLEKSGCHIDPPIVKYWLQAINFIVKSKHYLITLNNKEKYEHKSEIKFINNCLNEMKEALPRLNSRDEMRIISVMQKNSFIIEEKMRFFKNNEAVENIILLSQKVQLPKDQYYLDEIAAYVNSGCIDFPSDISQAIEKIDDLDTLLCFENYSQLLFNAVENKQYQLVDFLLDKIKKVDVKIFHDGKLLELLTNICDVKNIDNKPVLLIEKLLLVLVSSRFKINLSKVEDLAGFFKFKNKCGAFFHHRHKDFLKMQEIYHSLGQYQSVGLRAKFGWQ